MNRILWAIPGTALLLAQFVVAQAGINTPRPAKSKTPSSATKPGSDCRSEAVRTAHGIEFKDCTGKIEHEDLGNSNPGNSDATGPTSESGRRAVSVADLDPATRAKKQEALRAQYDYKIFSIQHAERTFEFQYWTGKIIFWIVLLIVFAGLGFSAVQFYVGLRHPLESRTKTGAKGPPQDDPSVSEFEATLQGIKLKSSVLGLIILAMSMVFFYLYLKYVYTITNLAP